MSLSYEISNKFEYGLSKGNVINVMKVVSSDVVILGVSKSEGSCVLALETVGGKVSRSLELCSSTAVIRSITSNAGFVAVSDGTDCVRLVNLEDIRHAFAMLAVGSNEDRDDKLPFKIEEMNLGAVKEGVEVNSAVFVEVEGRRCVCVAAGRCVRVYELLNGVKTMLFHFADYHTDSVAILEYVFYEAEHCVMSASEEGMINLFSMSRVVRSFSGNSLVIVEDRNAALVAKEGHSGKSEDTADGQSLNSSSISSSESEWAEYEESLLSVNCEGSVKSLRVCGDLLLVWTCTEGLYVYNMRGGCLISKTEGVCSLASMKCSGGITVGSLLDCVAVEGSRSRLYCFIGSVEGKGAVFRCDGHSFTFVCKMNDKLCKEIKTARLEYTSRGFKVYLGGLSGIFTCYELRGSSSKSSNAKKSKEEKTRYGKGRPY